MTREAEVLETGSGASTIWFAERVKNVISWEDLTPWHYAITDIIKEKELKNIIINFRPKGYAKKDFLKFKKQFDLVLLDGTGGASNRISAMRSGHKNVKPGGYLLVDDTHRQEEYGEGIEFLDNLGWEKIEFEGPDPNGEEKMATVYRKPESLNKDESK